MAHTDDLLNGFVPDPENFDFEKFKADALAAFNKDQAAADAKIRLQTQKIAEFEKSDVQLRAENYDLMMKSGTPIEGDDKTTGNESGNTREQVNPMDDLLSKIREG